MIDKKLAYNNYEVNIGIEVHVQLNTKSKIFCPCNNNFSENPNTNICQICTGQPGTLPVMNKEVITSAIKAGLGTNCDIAYISKFDRKHYFYPDLPKNYQITQNYIPICSNGYVQIRLEDNSIKNIPIVRIHIEEDAGKNIHGQYNESFVDLNRAGTPLLEIVTGPEISSSYEAKEYLKQLRLIMLYLQISTANMEEGAFRADTNISVRKKNTQTLGTKCELKNINSFKFIGDAIEYEIQRQIELLESGQKVIQETRLWDTNKKKTVVMRSKEEAADYRYFNDPDLPYIKIEQEEINNIKQNLPVLPNQKFEILVSKNGLTQAEAEILVNDTELLSYYEEASKYTQSKHLINWILRNLLSTVKEQKIPLNQCKITPKRLAKLIDLYDKNLINNRAAQEIFEIMSQDETKDPIDIVKEKGLEQIEDTAELEKIIKEIVEANPKQVEQYKSGKTKLFGFFVGQAMQKTQGNADPQILNELLKKYLD